MISSYKAKRGCPSRKQLLLAYPAITLYNSPVNRRLARAMIAFLLFSAVIAVSAAPRADLWPRWQRNDPNSNVTVDHSRFTQFLSRYLITDDPSGVNLLPYSRVSAEDRNLLSAYVKDMQGVQISNLNRSEQKAYWINLYNAFTVTLVLDNYPVDSIREINPGGGLFSGLFKSGPWDARLLRVEGQRLSLNDIEHRILRPIWKDNRIHYAVNCASIGCPNLQPVAYTAGNSDALLDKGAREYINNPRGVTFTKDGSLLVSSIYDWYQADFGGNVSGVIRHLRRYAAPQLAARLNSYSGELSFHYNWELNEPGNAPAVNG